MVQNEKGVIKQLQNMLTNHPERIHSKLHVTLIATKDHSLLERDEFEIYTNHPVKKITDKVEKLKLKGGFPTLEVEELVEKEPGQYILVLSV